ncbi:MULTISPECIES: mannitol dehydrogenase family protein [Citrobacter]|uniref:mannitol dehydrogenase family protein n=1 Tax=Citrobacter TaxID=544 RepID=UPI0015EA924F|nr:MULTISPECIES: mannitol dehydrogenase family protein [Citrobacter]EHG7581584.1 mannitol dehydrogenase family protein [Citrobacter sedlakii]EIQ7157003.1 mannitol dehydrogenase family protein [Citrobacter sedlakii]EKX8505533.1 mannitol dehydrogenase family protein [Citrobacter sedlakii]MBN6599353.1 mannitol dehydrogenase family protein [Citrobacter sedlakii]QMK45514.1 mannitol dehydrogenase family protein [Citrobacter sp. RHB21-C05]
MTTIASAILPDSVRTPQYDRSRLASRIVHFGFGAFHRAHQALLTDRVLNAQGGDWGICEISLFSGDRLMSQLRAQDHLYTVLEKGANGNQAIVIGAVHECLNAKLDSLTAIIEKFCEPQVAIVSLTITEKGYCIDPATGTLDLTHPRIRHDIDSPDEPHSAPGILVEALSRRRERGLLPFTVLSCDNIPDNGHVVKNAVLGMAEKRDPALAMWIREHVSFPGTMVDRIVPAATDETLDEISRALGVADPCGISCEPFIQWVIEDRFVAGRPAWETAGVQLVTDVRPWEEMKLRMLNGSHSFLAYLGYLSGFQHISECMQDEAFREAAYQLMMREQAPTLSITDVDLQRYAGSLIARFANPALKHKTWQIAMDGSQKLPQRMLAGVRIHLERGSAWPLLALGIAGWMRYVCGVDDAGAPIDVRDPLSDKIRLLVANVGENEKVANLLTLQEVFGSDLPKNPAFVQAIETAWQHLARHGAHQAVISTLKI